jgi:hypothetical protein
MLAGSALSSVDLTTVARSTVLRKDGARPPGSTQSFTVASYEVFDEEHSGISGYAPDANMFGSSPEGPYIPGSAISLRRK